MKNMDINVDKDAPIRWGIVGCGGIAHSFATALEQLPDANLGAVAARDVRRAEDFAQTYSNQGHVVRVHDSYSAVFKDPDIDVVYIATTHQNHVSLACEAIDSGMPVLVEKPVGLHSDEVAHMFQLAQEKEVFVMEAMWTRFLPATLKLLELLNSGVIGEIKLVQADFGIVHEAGPEGRLLNPDIGGGALWDLGIYPLTFTHLVYGGDAPEALESLMVPAVETGVDEMSTMIARYPKGRMAMLQSGFRLQVPHQARIYGDKGRVVVDDFFHPSGFTVYGADGGIEEHSHPYPSTGYQYEAAEVQRCLRSGLLSSPLCPPEETLSLIKIMDEQVKSWGLQYPKAL